MDNSVGKESIGIEAATVSPPRMRCAAPGLAGCTLYPHRQPILVPPLLRA
jgi:hypothetical protein